MFRSAMLPAMLLAVTGLFAQTDTPKEPFEFGFVERIFSAALGEERVLNILLPAGYHADSAARYPVIYLLDGSAGEDYAHIAGLVEFLGTYGVMPQTIVVGIANVDRERDFTYPPTMTEQEFPVTPPTGGSAAFIAFLESEVIPHVEAHYSVSERRTLIGQSLGGLVATEIFVRKPQLFTDYMIVSPSLWWDGESLLPQLETTLRTHPDLTQKVYISVGKEHPIMNRDVNAMVKLFKKYAPKGLEWHYVPFMKEDHATILHRSVYRGIELLNPRGRDR